LDSLGSHPIFHHWDRVGIMGEGVKGIDYMTMAKSHSLHPKSSVFAQGAQCERRKTLGSSIVNINIHLWCFPNPFGFESSLAINFGTTLQPVEAGPKLACFSGLSTRVR
jgi:hypothetical protein